MLNLNKIVYYFNSYLDLGKLFSFQIIKKDSYFDYKFYCRVPERLPLHLRGNINFFKKETDPYLFVKRCVLYVKATLKELKILQLS